MAGSSGFASPEEELAERFYRWELPGRGWWVWDRPVALEPPFRPFFGQRVVGSPVLDDGRKPTLVTGLLRWLQRLGGESKPESQVKSSEHQDVEPDDWEDRGTLVELRLNIPPDADIAKSASEQFLLSLSGCRGALSFEIVGLPDSILMQIVCGFEDVDAVGRPSVVFGRACVS